MRERDPAVKKLLIVSPYFPPTNAPDMQRVRMSLPYYRSCGWEPVVLTVGEAWQDNVAEPELLETIPGDIRIVRTRAWPSRWTRWLGVRNIGIRAWIHLFRAGSRILEAERFDAIFFSTTQFVVFALGPLWRRRHGVPYILDVQDPWRTDYYERPGSRRPPGGWKYQVARAQALLLEGPCFRNASAIMSVSPGYVTDLQQRHRDLARTPSAVIRFGASRADFTHAANARSSLARFSREHGEKHLVYTGAAGPVMPHALLVLFTALRRYRERAPERAARIRLHFIGTSYATPDRARPSVLPIAETCGVAANVQEVPHRVGLLEALRILQAADSLLLLGSSDLAYSPSKVYLYYLSGPPILGLVFQDSVMERLLEELSCAWIVRFAQGAPKDAAYAALERYFDAVLDGFGPGDLPQRNHAEFHRRFAAEALTREQCALFERAVSFKP